MMPNATERSLDAPLIVVVHPKAPQELRWMAVLALLGGKTERAIMLAKAADDVEAALREPRP